MRKCVFNFQNIESLKKFKQITSETTKFTNCFYNDSQFHKQIRMWTKMLKGAVYQCFQTVRVTQNKRRKLCKKFEGRKNAIKNKNVKQKNIFEEEISKEQAFQNISKIKKNLSTLKQSNNNQEGIWKIKNKFYPKIQANLPIAKYNRAGQIISNPEELKKVYLEHFIHRMRSRPILPHLEDYKKEIEISFEKILKITKYNTIPDWSLRELDKVLMTF